MTRDSFRDTLTLLRGAKNGDATCLHRVLERYRERLLLRIRLMMGAGARSSAESGDFLQGVFAEILDGFDRFEPRNEKAFLRWATQIARNNIRDHVRRKRERVFASFAMNTVGGVADLSDPEGGPPTAAVNKERVEALVDALSQLSPDHQRVIELRHLDGLGFAQIGRLLGRSENAVQLLHARAILSLGAVLRR